MTRSRLNAIALFILAGGLSAALVIWLFADDEAVHPIVYEMSISKHYVRELQRFGGKMALLFDDINRWFASLWHGKRLALTIAALSTGASLALYLIARRYPRG